MKRNWVGLGEGWYFPKRRHFDTMRNRDVLSTRPKNSPGARQRVGHQALGAHGVDGAAEGAQRQVADQVNARGLS